MYVIEKIQNAINDFFASEARHPERIYLGLNQKSRLADEVQRVNVTQLRDAQPQYVDIKITDKYDGVRIYYVNDDDHFHVC